MATFTRQICDEISFRKNNSWVSINADDIANKDTFVGQSGDYKNMVFGTGVYADSKYNFLTNATSFARVIVPSITTGVSADYMACAIDYTTADNTQILNDANLGIRWISQGTNTSTGFTQASDYQWSFGCYGQKYPAAAVEFEILVPNVENNFQFQCGSENGLPLIFFSPDSAKLLKGAVSGSSQIVYSIIIEGERTELLTSADWQNYKEYVQAYWVNQLAISARNAQKYMAMRYYFRIDRIEAEYYQYFSNTLVSELRAASNGYLFPVPQIVQV